MSKYKLVPTEMSSLARRLRIKAGMIEMGEQDAHTGQLKRERQDHVRGYGWIAVTKARDFTPEAIAKIFKTSVHYSQN